MNFKQNFLAKLTKIKNNVAYTLSISKKKIYFVKYMLKNVSNI